MILLTNQGNITMNKDLICSCPFTGELYEGELTESTCDDCGDTCTYVDEGYGMTMLVLCGGKRCKRA